MDIRPLLPILGLLLSNGLHAQQSEPVARSGDSTQTISIQQPDSGEPREMRAWLNLAKEQQQIERLMSLGVDEQAAEAATPSRSVYFRWNPIRTGSREPFATLFLPCNEGDDAHLYVLAHENKLWHVVDGAALDCHYDNSVSVEVAPVRRSDVDEVLVHHSGAGHGAGISEQNFHVYSVLDGKLRLELDTDEVIKVSRPHLSSKGRYDLIQQSTFVLIPKKLSDSKVIEETRSSTLNDRLTVHRRLFRWNAAKGRYLPSRFMVVDAEGDIHPQS